MIAMLFLAQLLTVAPGDRFAWEMQGPGLALVQSYRYEVEVDGYRLSEPLKDVTCAAVPSGFECTAPIPWSLGPHTVRVRSVDLSVMGLPAIEGPWSPPFAYVMVARPVPAAPGTPRVVPPAPGPPRPVKPKP